jgi:very-short-patch-repair endonuclease
MSKTTDVADAIWTAVGLPVPQREYRFDAVRRWRFDFAFPEIKLAVEIDGGVWTRGRHTRGAGYGGDMEKFNAATLAGWRVLHYTPQNILTNIREIAHAAEGSREAPTTVDGRGQPRASNTTANARPQRECPVCHETYSNNCPQCRKDKPEMSITGSVAPAVPPSDKRCCDSFSAMCTPPWEHACASANYINWTPSKGK